VEAYALTVYQFHIALGQAQAAVYALPLLFGCILHRLTKEHANAKILYKYLQQMAFPVSAIPLTQSQITRTPLTASIVELCHILLIGLSQVPAAVCLSFNGAAQTTHASARLHLLLVAVSAYVILHQAFTMMKNALIAFQSNIVLGQVQPAVCALLLSFGHII
jgi:hypothetical protein